MTMKSVSGFGTFRTKVLDVGERFRLGPHYTIDRFGIKVVMLAISGVLVMTLCGYGAYQAGQAVLGEQSLYTGKFTTSRTGALGVADGVYRNAAGTRSLVMMHFDADASMSSKAEDYEAFVMGIDGDKSTSVKAAMAGQIYVFGETRQLGVLLEAPNGLPQQMINITMRAKKELVAPAATPGGATGGSFADHDQWRIVINPGGSSAIALSALDTEATPSAESIYADVVTWQAERAQRRKLDSDLAQMKAQLDAIATLTDQMNTTDVQIGADRRVRLLPPSLPLTISGDSMSGLSATELRKALGTSGPDSIDGIRDKTARARQLDTYADGYLPNTYVLTADQTMPGGLDFDWRSRGVSDGYFEGLNTGSPSIAEYLAKVQSSKTDAFHSRELRWPLSNGKTTDDIKGIDVGARPLLELRNKAIAAYDMYFTLKNQYETYDLVQLLVMESELDSVASTATVSGGSAAVNIRS